MSSSDTKRKEIVGLSQSLHKGSRITDPSTTGSTGSTSSPCITTTTTSFKIGKKVSKIFGGEYYDGKIVEIYLENGRPLHRIEFEDGDCEDFSSSEVEEWSHEIKDSNIATWRPTKSAKRQGRGTNESKGANPRRKRKKTQKDTRMKDADADADADTHVVQQVVGKRGRLRKKVSYVYRSDSEFTESDPDPDSDACNEIEAPPAKKVRSKLNNTRTTTRSTKIANNNKARNKNRQHSDDSEFESCDEESDEELSVDADADTKPESETDRSNHQEDQTTGRNSLKSLEKKAKSAAAATRKSAEPPTSKKKMSDSFQPMNAPPYKKMSLKEIHEQKEFLDPCGMEATDGIIDRLVGQQVDKIGAMLARALKNKETTGSADKPLKLGTACSGTDAPALALTLVMEQMEQRGMKPVNFSHEFSCEVEPFKQAYLARNFDSVLYPDISKLTDDPPRDVYGQETPIPPFNLFVAGTSCKDFSMLRTTRRIDIEDRGCSGETFLAAVEFLFKVKPSQAIFENVIGAPWIKMMEYITGRIKLSECSSSKAIKADKASKQKDLLFILDENGDIVVDYVPAVFGVRCGAIVDGYLNPDSTVLRSVKWPEKKGKGIQCTLEDLMKANKIVKARDTLVFKTDVTYCTHLCKVDTKDYGLPQTRQRTYLFVWQPDDGNVSDDLGIYWQSIVKYLQSPVRHSLQSFVLDVDHDVIRLFREALNGPPGRQTKRSCFQEPDFWNSTNANLPHNKNTRAALGVKDEARFITSWGPHGQKQLPPHYWLEYVNCNNQRILDLIDILHASAARDAESHDSSFASFFWNVSQNATREKHRTATPGIAGCITPGGDFFLPMEGRPLTGTEKLLCQGIPYFRLILGNITEVQLGDLAGNAMSLTVVCATMLAAITAKQLRLEVPSAREKEIQAHLEKKCALESYEKAVRWGGIIKNSNPEGPPACSEVTPTFFQHLAALGKQARDSSIWCTCETSGSMSSATSFAQCKMCRVSCCRNCLCSVAGYNLDGHDTVDVELTSQVHVCSDVQAKIRQLAPSSLYFNESGIREIANLQNDDTRVSGLDTFVFQLHRLKRRRKCWEIVYYARDANKIGENLAELRIRIGEIGRSIDSEEQLGAKAQLKSFIPARTEPLVFGLLGPCAMLTVLAGEDVSNAIWMGKAMDTVATVQICGEGMTDSNRIDVGIMDEAASALRESASKGHNSNDFDKACRRGEERRWLYAEGWKVWPKRIRIIGAPKLPGSCWIDGTYERMTCRRTINQGALWIRKSEGDGPSLFLLLRPNVSRTGPDQGIVSLSLDYEDECATVCVFPLNWQPCDALNEKLHLQDLRFKHWVELPSLKCLVPESNLKVTSTESETDTLFSVTGLSEGDVRMLQRGSKTAGRVKLNMTNGTQAQQSVRSFNAICVAPVLKHAARHGLKLETCPEAVWRSLAPANESIPFGTCKKTLPDRPSETWFLNEDRNEWERCTEAGASRAFYLKVQEAPRAFEFWLESERQELVVKFNPQVVAHHAAGHLIRGRGGDMEKRLVVSYRLIDMSQQSDPVPALFKVKNANALDPTDVHLRAPHKLYSRQKKVVTKMIAIEEGETTFEELEISEFEMPGSTGFSLAAKATLTTPLRGGVICDSIGSGKTVISIALILNDINNARKQSGLPNKSGATCVAVPPGLIDQWSSEIEKFSIGLKVVKVYDFKSLQDLPLDALLQADVITVNIDILESKGYLENLLTKAGLGKEVDNLPGLPQYVGQLEVTQAKGVWIPNTSTDPYAGANNPRNQRRRNHSAFYTYMYLKAIEAVRSKTFKGNDKGIPLEYLEFHRVIVDEIHESLCTTKSEIHLAKDTAKEGSGSFFEEKNRRAARELLGITLKDIRKRPLRSRRAVFGLTGTPLLDSSSRVTELANLMGGTYVTGLASHWRKLERESGRDIFLHAYLEPRQTREVRKTINRKCQDYLDIACTRNKSDDLNGIQKKEIIRFVRMTHSEKESFLGSQSGIPPAKRSLSIKPEDFDPSAGHDISKFLRENVNLKGRGVELVRICKEILAADPTTKIVVFADGRIGGGESARSALQESGLGCTWLDKDDSIQMKNKKISWYQHGDATEEDRKRPRVLVLHFAHAAGLNLQTECYNLILFSPLYTGVGGASGDPVVDVSTEEQAIGRVHRPGQTHAKVFVYRIEVRGPENEECLDGHLIRRNTDEETKRMAMSAGDE